MRAFTTKGGQIFEVWENRKEALHDVADIIDGIRYAIEIGQRTDDLLWVLSLCWFSRRKKRIKTKKN